MLVFGVMDAKEISNLENFCSRISSEIGNLFSNLSLYIIVSNPEKKADAVASIVSKLTGHPAFNEAFPILKAYVNSGMKSEFLGVAEGQESIVFSFNTKPITLAFIAIDTSLYDEYTKATQATYYLLSLFLDTYSNHLKKPLNVNGSIFLQKLSPALTCKQNLKADIYSILQLLREGQYDAPQLLAKQRCMDAITPQSKFNPEDFAFPIALDVIAYTIEKQIYATVSNRGSSPLVTQYQLAEQIASCFEIENFQSWIQFCNNSQTMAWSGFSPSDILGAAVNTSTNPFIKAIGHMLSEITNLPPSEESHLPFGYNPFLAEEINKIRHERAAEETFEMILIHVIEAESHLPLLRVANNQNEALIKGKIVGWCASSLHAAAKAYMGAKQRGIPPIQAARLEFQSAYLQTNWNILKDLKQHIIEVYREGKFVTMGELQKWTDARQEASFISDSLYITISDPKYTRVLDLSSLNVSQQNQDDTIVLKNPVPQATPSENPLPKEPPPKPKEISLEFDER
jgi:hypothetical protein